MADGQWSRGGELSAGQCGVWQGCEGLQGLSAEEGLGYVVS